MSTGRGRGTGAARIPALPIALLLCLSLAACGGEEGGDESLTATKPPAEVPSARSASFDRYSGTGSGELALAEFGAEASRTDRLSAQGAIVAYLGAVQDRRWEVACRHLGQSLRAQIAEIVKKAKQRPKPTCGEVLVALIGPGKARERSPLAGRPIVSLRVKAGPDGGFALFHGSDGEDYWLAVKREGGRWRMLGVSPVRFTRPEQDSNLRPTP